MSARAGGDHLAAVGGVDKTAQALQILPHEAVGHGSKTAGQAGEVVGVAGVAHVAHDKGQAPQHEIVVVGFGVQEPGVAFNLGAALDFLHQALPHSGPQFAVVCGVFLQQGGGTRVGGKIAPLQVHQPFAPLDCQIHDNPFGLFSAYGVRPGEGHEPAALQQGGRSGSDVEAGVGQGLQGRGRKIDMNRFLQGVAPEAQ